MIPFSCQTIASRLGDGYDFVRVFEPCFLVGIYRPGRHVDVGKGGTLVEDVTNMYGRCLTQESGGGKGAAIAECPRTDACHSARDFDGFQGGAAEECVASDGIQRYREVNGGQGRAMVECVVSDVRDALGQLDGPEDLVVSPVSGVCKFCCVVARIGGAREVEVGQHVFVPFDGLPVVVVDLAACHGDGFQVDAAAYQGGKLAGLEVAYRQLSAAKDGDAPDGGAALLVVQHHEDFALGVRVGGGDGEDEVNADGDLPSVGDGYQVEVVRGGVVDAGDNALYFRRLPVGQGYTRNIERQADARVAGHLEGAAVVGQLEDYVVGVRGVDTVKEAVAFRARIARVTFLAVLAADARPGLAAVHAQVDGVGLDVFVLRVGGDALVGELRARGQLGQRGIVAVGAGFALLALRAVGADGVAVGVGQELAVQRPVPVAVVGLRGAYLRGVALVTLVALRAVVDGDGGRVQEADGEAYFHAVLHDGRHGGDVVRGAEQGLEGLDVGVGFGLPGFEGGDALGLGGQLFGVPVHLVPQGGVVVTVVTRGGGYRQRHNGQYFVNLF